MANKTCEQCKQNFEYNPPVGYPDKRKYCDKCSAERKASWEAKKAQPQASKAQTAPTNSANGTIINIKDKPHSFEFGKAGARMKVYYNEFSEVQAQIDMAVQAGLIDDPKLQKFE